MTIFPINNIKFTNKVTRLKQGIIPHFCTAQISPEIKAFSAVVSKLKDLPALDKQGIIKHAGNWPLEQIVLKTKLLQNKTIISNIESLSQTQGKPARNVVYDMLYYEVKPSIYSVKTGEFDSEQVNNLFKLNLKTPQHFIL